MRLKLFRRITQTLTIALLVAIPLMNLKGVSVLSGSLYSLAVGPVWITDPLSGLQVMIAALGADGTLMLSMAIPVAAAFALGRVFCSWVCPQNALSELFDCIAQRLKPKRLLRMIPTPWPRYSILVFCLALTIMFGFPVANLISAPGIISVQISEYLMAYAVGWETAMIAAIIVGEFFLVRRFWCNFVCPVGGMLGLFRFRKTLRVVHSREDGHACIGCGDCAKACQLGLNPPGGRIYPLCHNCGDCIAACDNRKDRGGSNPLSFKFRNQLKFKS